MAKTGIVGEKILSRKIGMRNSCPAVGGKTWNSHIRISLGALKSVYKNVIGLFFAF